MCGFGNVLLWGPFHDTVYTQIFLTQIVKAAIGTQAAQNCITFQFKASIIQTFRQSLSLGEVGIVLVHHTHSCTRLRTNTRSRTHARTHAHTHTHTHTYTQTYARTHTHMSARAHRHTHTHTHNRK